MKTTKIPHRYAVGDWVYVYVGMNIIDLYEIYSIRPHIHSVGPITIKYELKTTISGDIVKDLYDEFQLHPVSKESVAVMKLRNAENKSTDEQKTDKNER